MPNILPLVLVPAYGRTYKTKKEALSDWKAGKDFKIKVGPYCSIRDLADMKADFPAGVWLEYRPGQVIESLPALEDS